MNIYYHILFDKEPTLIVFGCLYGQGGAATCGMKHETISADWVYNAHKVSHGAIMTISAPMLFWQGSFQDNLLVICEDTLPEQIQIAL